MAKGYPDYRLFSVPISVVEGGTGTDSPALLPGPGIEITGSWPNHTIINTSPASALGDPVTVAHGGTGTTTGSITGTGALTFAAGGTDQDIKLTPSGLGNVLVPRLNNIRFADQFPGADAGAKIAAAIADLPATGGTVDARGLVGAQAASATIALNKPVTLLLGAITLTGGTAANPVIAVTSELVTIRGIGRASQIQTTGNNDGITVNVSGVTQPQSAVEISDLLLSGPGGGTGTGIKHTHGRSTVYRNLSLLTFGQDGFYISGSTAASTNSNALRLDGIQARSNGRYGIYITGDNAGVGTWTNIDCTNNGTGQLFIDSRSNFITGVHLDNETAASTFSLRFGPNAIINRVHGYVEGGTGNRGIIFDAGSTSNQFNNTNGYTSPAYGGTVSDSGTANSYIRSVSYADPTISQMNFFARTLGTGTVGTVAGSLAGFQSEPRIMAENTQNWTSGLALTGFDARPIIETGATGTIAGVVGLHVLADLRATTTTNYRGIWLRAPQGAGTISNKWSIQADTGAGIAEIADGVKTANQFVSTLATGTAPLVVSSTTEVANLRAATATDLAAGSILSVAKGGTGTTTGSITGTGELTFTASGAGGDITLTPSTSGVVKLSSEVILASGKTAFVSSTFPAIYATASGSTYPFDAWGHLVVQPRSSGALRDIVFANGVPAVVVAVIDSTGKVGIGTTAPKSKLHVVGLPVYANNAAAVAGGLTAGAFYRTGADPDPVCVVH
jgi:hypothetical protein